MVEPCPCRLTARQACLLAPAGVGPALRTHFIVKSVKYTRVYWHGSEILDRTKTCELFNDTRRTGCAAEVMHGIIATCITWYAFGNQAATKLHTNASCFIVMQWLCKWTWHFREITPCVCVCVSNFCSTVTRFQCRGPWTSILCRSPCADKSHRPPPYPLYESSFWASKEAHEACLRLYSLRNAFLLVQY